LKQQFPHRYNPKKIDPSVFLAPGSIVVGDVWIGAESSVWFNSILRGDVNFIRVGQRTNIQDLCMVHVASHSYSTRIGDDVTVGHSVVLHACTIGNQVLIGMGCVVMDGAEIGDNVILGAGSLVTKGTKIPSGTKAFGRPAKVVGTLSPDEVQGIKTSAMRYVALAQSYRYSPL
jgi:carbonic anhydrase/acetyltransferase-like protein (isoleucine patch superfamily)